MAAVTICSDFGAQENKVSLFPHLFAMNWWDQMPWFSFFECWVLSQLFHSSLSSSSRCSLVPFHFLPWGWYYLHIWCYWYFSWQCWFNLELHSAQHFSWCILHVSLNKQGDNMQPWCTPFPVLNQFVVPCPVLTIASWPVYRFLRRQIRWSGIPIS